MANQQIQVHNIKVGTRFRKLDDDKVDELAKSISVIGLLHPIVIDTKNNLLSGHHRLEAHRKLGREFIECKLVSMSELENELIQIDENLILNQLSVLEISEHLIRREEILTKLGKRSTVRDNQYAGVNSDTSTTKELADEIGISERKYQRIKQIYKINDSARLILKDSVIDDNLDALLLIERLQDDGLQIEIANRIKNGYAGKIRHLIKDIQNEIKQNEMLSQLDNYNNSDDDKVQLYHGDFRTESQNIADASIDLIFTDGPYLDSIELYKSMSEIGSRVLKDGGSLLCYLTQTELPAVLSAMSEYLHYYWIIALKHGGATGRHGRGIFVEYKPILWFVKGKRERTDFVADFIQSEPSGKVYHEWEQSEVESDYYISHLTNVGDIVVDFMMGSGTTAISAGKMNRKFIGFEIEERTFGIAKGRITNRDKIRKICNNPKSR